MDLAQAVQHRHLVHWHDHGFVRTVEPYLLALIRGHRIVLIARQVAGGQAGERQGDWKLIDVTDGLNVDVRNTFEPAKPVPPHLQELVHLVYASPADSPSAREERR